MAIDRIKSGIIKIEVRVINTEKLLNILWSRNIRIYKIKKKNISTLSLEINYIDYVEVNEIVTSLNGKIKIINAKGFVFVLGKMKKQISLVVGGVLFLFILYFLSNYIWAIDISVKENVAPFEIRKQLMSLGIKPGISKRDVDVREVEKKLENMNSEIMWLRVRIEGSTLKVKIEEKINPPAEWSGNYGNLVANKGGEVQRVYTYAGKSVVEPGTIVKEGDLLIKGIDGMEGQEFLIKPRGIVIANTFYEKTMQLKIDGTKLERSGRADREIYINIFGKKLYLKKANKGFANYDKIEKGGKIFNEVVYYERVDVPVKLTEEEATKIAMDELEKSLKQELTREAKVVDKKVTKQTDGEGNIRVNVVFVVEENILRDIPVNY